MGIAGVIFAVLFSIFVGYFVVLIVNERLLRISVIEQISFLGFLGLLLISYQMLFYSLVSIKLTTLTIIVFWIVVIPILVICKLIVRRNINFGTIRFLRTRFEEFKSDVTQDYDKGRYVVILQLIFLVLILYRFFYVLTISVAEPVWNWDSIAMWNAKAKIFYFEGSPEIAKLPAAGYPLFISLIQTWVYFCLGAWDDSVGKIVFPLIFILVLIGFYKVSKRYSNRSWALFFTVVLSFVPALSSNLILGFADGVLGLIFCLGMLYLYRYFTTQERNYLLLAAVYIGSGGWIKAEGVPLFVLAFIVFVLFELRTFRRSKKVFLFDIVRFFLLAVIFFLPWLIIKKAYHIKPIQAGAFSLANLFNQLSFSRLMYILGSIGKEMLKLKSWGFIWIALWVAIIVNFKKILRSADVYLFILILLGLVFLIGVYMTTGADIIWHIKTSLDRLMLDFLPLVFFFVGLQFYKFYSGEHAKGLSLK